MCDNDDYDGSVGRLGYHAFKDLDRRLTEYGNDVVDLSSEADQIRVYTGQLPEEEAAAQLEERERWLELLYSCIAEWGETPPEGTKFHAELERTQLQIEALQEVVPTELKSILTCEFKEGEANPMIPIGFLEDREDATFGTYVHGGRDDHWRREHMSRDTEGHFVVPEVGTEVVNKTTGEITWESVVIRSSDIEPAWAPRLNRAKMWFKYRKELTDRAGAHEEGEEADPDYDRSRVRKSMHDPQAYLRRLPDGSKHWCHNIRVMGSDSAHILGIEPYVDRMPTETEIAFMDHWTTECWCALGSRSMAEVWERPSRPTQINPYVDAGSGHLWGTGKPKPFIEFFREYWAPPQIMKTVCLVVQTPDYAAGQPEVVEETITIAASAAQKKWKAAHTITVEKNGVKHKLKVPAAGIQQTVVVGKYLKTWYPNKNVIKWDEERRKFIPVTREITYVAQGGLQFRGSVQLAPDPDLAYSKDARFSWVGLEATMLKRKFLHHLHRGEVNLCTCVETVPSRDAEGNYTKKTTRKRQAWKMLQTVQGRDSEGKPIVRNVVVFTDLAQRQQ